MNTQYIQAFSAEARRCAIAMMEAGAFIQRELPRVALPENLREAAAQVCSQLIEEKHDAFSEIFELPEVIEAGDKAQLERSVNRILGGLAEAVRQLQELTDAIQAAAGENPEFQAAFFLYAESFMGIADLFARAQEAAALIRN